jgi:hypothetical protein
VVKELDVEQDVWVELLDAGEDEQCSSWGEQLPKRLKELHSHWICRCAPLHLTAC